jgi:hypothetical protein
MYNVEDPTLADILFDGTIWIMPSYAFWLTEIFIGWTPCHHGGCLKAIAWDLDE